MRDLPMQPAPFLQFHITTCRLSRWTINATARRYQPLGRFIFSHPRRSRGIHRHQRKSRFWTGRFDGCGLEPLRPFLCWPILLRLGEHSFRQDPCCCRGGRRCDTLTGVRLFGSDAFLRCTIHSSLWHLIREAFIFFFPSSLLLVRRKWLSAR